MPDPSHLTATALTGRAALIGIAAGLRSQLPLALLSAGVGRGDIPNAADWPFRLLRSRPVRRGLAAAAIGELIADKTPFVPDRIEPGPLAGRLVFGGLAAALFARLHGLPASRGFALGAASAGAGAFAGYRARVTLPGKTGLPDPVWAVAEDLVAYTLARVAIRPPGRPIMGPAGANPATLATYRLPVAGDRLITRQA